MIQHHKADADLVLLVAHGGINFQIVKAAVCVPVPRVCILHWGNCTTTQLRFRDRRDAYMAEVTWHVPIELMGGSPI
jgi:broad specificity phosphatase PhoE